MAFSLHAQTTGADSADENVTMLPEVHVLDTAENELRQAPGVSIITEEDIEKRPPVNDISELVRTQPGVNLTGSSASGQYGNNRQIDIRGMGPENTLILIDGVPVSSRNSARMGRSGERDSRGDSNWVPVEAIERIEVIRGPAAARYGSGAAGGVVNIITKKPAKALAGSVTLYANAPRHSAEGSTRRAGFMLSGPLAEQFSFRLYGNANKTDADSLRLNEAYNTGATAPAGREGVRNRDINGLLRWDLTASQVLELSTGFSRQGNIYAGDRAVNTNGNDLLTELANEGEETNTIYRRTSTLTHRGNWGEGRTSRLTFSYEGTDNKRYDVGLAGSVEGSISSSLTKSTSALENYLFGGEYNTPVHVSDLTQMVTVGFEFRKERLNDPFSVSQSDNTGSGIPGVDSGTRNGKSDASNFAVFIEDNMEVLQDFIVTPGLRFDHHDRFGNNWSPSLNTSYNLTPQITLKGGIARAFKAPNLYQSNPNYLYYSRGNGCPMDFPSLGGGCYVRGNADLDAETSVNKEVGIAYNNESGWIAGLTYFQNDYKNKIIADMSEAGAPEVVGNSQVFQWFNSGKAVIRGLESNLTVPLLRQGSSTLRWINNVTYMIKNKSKSTNQPLSVIPRYTLNSILDWQVSSQWSAQLTSTLYGRQKPRTRLYSGAAATGAYLNERGSYALFGASIGYDLHKNLRMRVGLTNIADKRLYRESTGNAQGTATYNEPGRTFYVTMTASF